MGYSITSNLSINHWEKRNFKPIGDSVNKAEFLDLGKALIIYIDYLMFYLVNM